MASGLIKLKYIAMGTLLAVVFSGCMSNMAASVGVDTTHTQEQSAAFVAGDYKKSAEIAISSKDKEAEIDEAHLLETLRGANTLLYAKDYKTSIDLFDDAERSIKFHREEILASNTADYLAKIIVNDAAVDYHASAWDSVLVNTYKAIDYMALGKTDEARVELNRAVDRQRLAKEVYAEHIKKQKDAIEEKRKTSGDGFAKTIDNPQIDSLVRKNYSNLYTFEAYPDFVNPFTTYLAGVFFTIDGDYSKASTMLKEAYGMMPENKTAQDDFVMVEEALNTGKPISKSYVWVIYENGMGPIKDQYKINIPLFLFTNRVKYTGIALPKIKTRSLATPGMDIYVDSKCLASTQNIADMDRVILTEFKFQYPYIVTRAVLSTFVKTYTQYQIQKNLGGWAGIAAGVLQFATTQADTRIWNTVGKHFEVARVEMPQNHALKLKAGGHNIDVNLGANAKHSIVYVRIPTAMSTPSVTVANF